jgi:pyruvate/2-oxoglutarate dehydrogenase complex dihydrolipoamide dehydrogenase (E3) component
MPEPDRYDVVIIGSGEGGKHLAWEMAEAGQRTADGGRRTPLDRGLLSERQLPPQ